MRWKINAKLSWYHFLSLACSRAEVFWWHSLWRAACYHFHRGSSSLFGFFYLQCTCNSPRHSSCSPGPIWESCGTSQRWWHCRGNTEDQTQERGHKSWFWTGLVTSTSCGRRSECRKHFLQTRKHCNVFTIVYRLQNSMEWFLCHHLESKITVQNVLNCTQNVNC